MTTDALLTKLKEPGPIAVELGCGPNKTPGAIGVDYLPLPGVDIVHDLEQGLSFLPDQSVDEVRSRHFLEHIEHFEPLMREIHRVLRPGGRQVVVVPHFPNPYYYSDYTHRRFFGLYTFDYLAVEDPRYRRRVPAFYSDFHFRVLERRLVFKSPFPVRNLFKQGLNRLFNATPYLQELYEEQFCYVWPCQEIEFVLTPVPRS